MANMGPLSLLLLFLGLLHFVHSLASTDSARDADVPQSGYLPNHNMDPAIVDSPIFGLQWKIPFNSKEQVCLKSHQQISCLLR
jgi:hypothetical protein